MEGESSPCKFGEFGEF